MDRFTTLICIITCIIHCQGEGETVLSAVLTPDEKSLLRQQRSYYDRYGYGRPYERLDDRPSRCGRCDDDDEDDDDYDRGRGRDRDDDRRPNRPTYGSRNDRNDRNDRNNDDDNRRYDDRYDRNNKNGTDDHDDKNHDNKDSDRPHRRRNKNRSRYDDRDRYRPDYYDRFLRDPYRDRFYDDPYRRPVYDRYYPDRYDDYARDGYGYSGYRRPYEERYDRGGGYLDPYGGYGPGVGRGSHDSFRPWDETYRGQAGWDSGGRGYYFASGRPEASTWTQQQYARPVAAASSGAGWQTLGYSPGASYSGGYAGYRDPGTQTYRDPGTQTYRDPGTQTYRDPGTQAYQGYRGSGYSSAAGGYQDLNYGGYGQASGWRNVGERRPYRDQSGVAHLDTKVTQDQNPSYDRYGQNRPSYQPQPGSYPQTSSSSPTPGTSYLFQREDEVVTSPETTATPGPS